MRPLVLLLLALLSTAAGRAATPARSVVSTPASTSLLAMERVENVSEELANDLVDLAGVLARRDFAQARDWLSVGFQGETLFAGTPAVDSPRPGVQRETYPARAGAPVDGARWLDGLSAPMSTWRRVEDVRIKVKESRFQDMSGKEGHATLFSRFEGTDGSGRPVAVTAWFDVEARFEKDRFRLVRLSVRSLEILRAERAAFRDVAAAAGVASATVSAATLTGFNWNWQGVAAGDIDGDGRVDVFVPSVPKNHLYRNLGNGRFVDVGPAWGVDAPGGGTGALLFDMDNDGDQDLFVCFVEGPGITLFENTGTAFKDVSVAAGVRRSTFAYSAAAADIDNDGLLDVYVSSYNAYGRVAPDSWIRATNGTPNLLFRNLGNGRFEECAAARGVADRRWSYAAAFADFDEDGDQDLAVANDYGDKGLFINDGKGFFRDEAARYGAADTGNGMGVDWGDADGDGRLDLYFMNMSSTAGNRILKRLYPGKAGGTGEKVVKLAAGNSLLSNRPGGFVDVTGPSKTGPAEWAWGGGFLDFDNDGHLDLYVANGFITGKTAKDT